MNKQPHIHARVGNSLKQALKRFAVDNYMDESKAIRRLLSEALRAAKYLR